MGDGVGVSLVAHLDQVTLHSHVALQELNTKLFKNPPSKWFLLHCSPIPNPQQSTTSKNLIRVFYF